MKNFDFDWQTNDELTLRGKCWLPSNEEPRALICLVHGFGEYFGRYEHVAKFWTDQNIGLIAYDLRGHGISDGKRGYVPHYNVMMEDIGSFLSLIKEKFSNIPLFLYGHSMGGNLVANFALRYKTDFLKGVIITSPWFRLAKEPPALKVIMGKLVSKIIPSFRDTAILEVKGLSRDLEVGRAYLRDDLIHNKMGVKLFLGTTEVGEQLLVEAKDFKHTSLIMHGAEDPITSCEATQYFAENLGKDPTFKLWEEMRHELHNEIDKEKVLDFMLEWVEEVLIKNSSTEN